MSKKSNIDSNVTVRGTSPQFYSHAPGSLAPNGTTVTVARKEIRKVVRDSSSPTTRNEKPYTRMVSIAKLPTGGLYYGHKSNGRHYYAKGELGDTYFQGGINATMGFPYSSPKYTPGLTSWPLNPDLLSQAEVKAYMALRKLYKELDASSYQEAGLFYAERKETASLFRDAVHAFGRFVSGVRSMSARDVVRAIKDFGVDVKPRNLWKRVKRELQLMRQRLGRGNGPSRQRGEAFLSKTAYETLKTSNRLVLAYKLGVTPLMQTLDGAYLGLLQTVADPTSLLIKGKGWVTRHENEYEETTLSRGFVTVKQRANCLLRYGCVLVARPSDTDLARLERLGVANPVSLLAEVTSCSFFLNYFYPILDYLKAVGTPMAFEFVDGSYSKKVSRIQDSRYESTSWNGKALATGNWTHVEYVRKVYGTFPVPIPPLSLRGQDLSVNQALVSTSLILEKSRKILGLP